MTKKGKVKTTRGIRKENWQPQDDKEKKSDNYKRDKKGKVTIAGGKWKEKWQLQEGKERKSDNRKRKKKGKVRERESDRSQLKPSLWHALLNSSRNLDSVNKCSRQVSLGAAECELDALHLSSKIGNELKHVNRKSTPSASFQCKWITQGRGRNYKNVS